LDLLDLVDVTLQLGDSEKGNGRSKCKVLSAKLWDRLRRCVWLIAWGVRGKAAGTLGHPKNSVVSD